MTGRTKERGIMKLTELNVLPATADSKLDGDNPRIAVRRYCRTRYVLEDEGRNVRLASGPRKGLISHQPRSG